MTLVALYVYDCVITFADEVTLVWTGRPTLATLAYALNRYGFLLYLVFFSVLKIPFDSLAID